MASYALTTRAGARPFTFFKKCENISDLKAFIAPKFRLRIRHWRSEPPAHNARLVLWDRPKRKGSIDHTQL